MALITTRYDAKTTADEVVQDIDLTGRRAVVTGGASGIGVETARSLARAGADVVLAVRNVTVGEEVATDIRSSTGGSVTVAHVDLTDRATVKAFTDAWSGPLHLLINNAGVMATPLTRTTEGWELQFATNHLGHFALTTGLHGALAAAGGARVVNVSSTGHLRSPVVFEDIDFEHRAYDPWAAYGQSKTANVLLAVEVTRRWAAEGIVANALMPGGIMTNLQRHVDQEVIDGWEKRIKTGEIEFKNTQQGASTTLVAAVTPEFSTGGHYLEDCNESETVADDAEVNRGVREWALDPVAAERLWEVSLTRLG